MRAQDSTEDSEIRYIANRFLNLSHWTSHAQLRKRFEKFEAAKPDMVDVIKSTWYKYRPALRSKLTRVERQRKATFAITANQFASMISEALHRCKTADNLSLRVQDMLHPEEKYQRILPVVTIAGYRGAGKTTMLEELKKQFAGQEVKPALIEMDAYFKEPIECRAPGGWDNPRNSHIGQLAKAIQDFKKGKKITVPIGRVPRHGKIEYREIDPKKTPVLVVEGIHAFDLGISKLADVRGFIYMPPGLQIVRTWLRDLDLSKRDKATKMPPEYYTGLNTRVRDWHNRFVLSRMKDADVIYEARWSKKDVERLSGMLGTNGEMTERLLDGWGIPHE